MSEPFEDSEMNDETNEKVVQEESNRIRKEYRSIRDKITSNRMDYVDPNSNNIEDTLERVESTFKDVKKPREAVSDSHILLELAILGKERIKNVHCVFRAFNNNEFMDKMRAYMLSCDPGRKRLSKNRSSQLDEDSEMMDDGIDEDEDQSITSRRISTASKASRGNSSNNFYVLTKPILSSFGKTAMNYFRLPPRPTFILGSLNDKMVFKQRQQRKRIVADRNLKVVETKIKELGVNSKEKEESSTLTETERIHEILKKLDKRCKGQPICLYSFVVHPKSFSRTIENLFYVSFLVKDGYAKIYTDETGLPAIQPNNSSKNYNPSEINKKNAENNINIQSMISMTKTEWKEIIEVFGIETAIIGDPKP